MIGFDYPLLHDTFQILATSHKLLVKEGGILDRPAVEAAKSLAELTDQMRSQILNCADFAQAEAYLGKTKCVLPLAHMLSALIVHPHIQFLDELKAAMGSAMRALMEIGALQCNVQGRGVYKETLINEASESVADAQRFLSERGATSEDVIMAKLSTIDEKRAQLKSLMPRSAANDSSRVHDSIGNSGQETPLIDEDLELSAEGIPAELAYLKERRLQIEILHEEYKQVSRARNTIDEITHALETGNWTVLA